MWFKDMWRKSRAFYLALSGTCLFLVHSMLFASQIPLEDFFRHAEFDDVALSPTGQYLAVSVPAGERRNLAVLDISDPSAITVTAAYELRSRENPMNVRWVSNERLIFTTSISVGSLEQPQMTGRIYAINADGSNRRQLFGTQAGSMVFRYMSVISYLPDEPGWILIEHWAHDRERPIAERLNVNRGRTSRVAVSPLNRGNLLADQNQQIRFAMGYNDDMEAEFAWRPSVDAPWQRFSNEISTDIIPIAFDDSGESVYVRSRAQDYLGLYKIELATGQITPVLGEQQVEVDRVKMDYSGTRLLGALFMDGYPAWKTIDELADEVQWLRQLEQSFEGYLVTIYNWTRDGRYAMVGVGGAQAPEEFFVLDTQTPELRFLAASRDWIDPARMQLVRPVSYQARDGLTIHGYKTLPAGYEEGDTPPFVVFVHGGPHGPRDRWQFDNWVQLFAHHGFGVLQVNFRGSGGYGIEFERAGYLEWGAKMQDDVTDGTLWLIDQGYADKDAVCIAGGSYGGYATLAGITREPDLYACAWAFVGVYSLPLMKQVGDIPRTALGRRYLDRVLGTDEDVLEERSPVNHVASIKTPLFISHGAEDIRAHVRHYHALSASLDEAGIEYESMLVENEGHGFYAVENNVAMMERVLAFMKRHTGLAD